MQREQHFVPREKATTAVFINCIRVIVIDDLDAVADVLVRLRVVDGIVKQLNVAVQTELIHEIDVAQVLHDEEEHRRALGDGPIAAPERIDLPFHDSERF